MFLLTGPPLAGTREIRGVQAMLAQDGLWHLQKFRARAENGKKTQFPGARGPRLENKSYHASRDGCPQLVCVSRFAPTRRKSQRTWILGHFGLGRPLALREILGLGRKQKNAISRCRGHFWGGKSGRPKSCRLKVRNFFHFPFCPHGREITKFRGFMPFWPRTALGIWRNSRRKTEKHKQPH